MPRFLAHAFLLGMVVACTACAADEAGLVIDATLVDVVDGDTLRVRLGSGPETVRLYGVDAPEARAPFGREATKALRALVGRGSLELRPVADDPYDKYDRLIAVVYADGINVNETLVADGMAWAYRRYLGQLEGDAAYCELEANARAAQRGLWSQPAGRWVPPWIWRRRQDSPPGARVPSRDYARETAADCVAAMGEPTPVPEVNRAPAPLPVVSGECRIKGNINGKGDRIYHLPGSRSYDDTRIDPAKGERWFCSEDEARKSGWREVR